MQSWVYASIPSLRENIPEIGFFSFISNQYNVFDKITIVRKRRGKILLYDGPEVRHSANVYSGTKEIPVDALYTETSPIVSML